MKWKNLIHRARVGDREIDPREVVSSVSEKYADLSDRGRIVMPRSSLPCSWFRVRECFAEAYEMEYLQLPQHLKDSYHQVYRNLAYFLDDSLCRDFDVSLASFTKSRAERCGSVGIILDESRSKALNAGLALAAIAEDRKKIWERVNQEVNCPLRDRTRVAETLIYCTETYRSLWDEWASFANFMSYLKDPGCP